MQWSWRTSWQMSTITSTPSSPATSCADSSLLCTSPRLPSCRTTPNRCRLPTANTKDIGMILKETKKKKREKDLRLYLFILKCGAKVLALPRGGERLLTHQAQQQTSSRPRNKTKLLFFYYYCHHHHLWWEEKNFVCVKKNEREQHPDDDDEWIINDVMMWWWWCIMGGQVRFLNAFNVDTAACERDDPENHIFPQAPQKGASQTARQQKEKKMRIWAIESLPPALSALLEEKMVHYSLPLIL